MVRGGIFPFFGMSFSCCWKDVRLKLIKRAMLPRLLRVSVVVERMYDWSRERPRQSCSRSWVSVVVERMYDWSTTKCVKFFSSSCFSCCWKDVRLKRKCDYRRAEFSRRFSCCWKDVRLKLLDTTKNEVEKKGFSCCWKDVRLKPVVLTTVRFANLFQLLLKGCTIEAGSTGTIPYINTSFSCCWKDVRLKLSSTVPSACSTVSVVVERMYDWSSTDV